jgi:hypothetical protein
MKLIHLFLLSILIVLSVLAYRYFYKSKGVAIDKIENLGYFYGISNGIAADIDVRHSDIQSVEIIEGKNDASDIMFRVEKGILKISRKRKLNLFREPVSILISTPEIRHLIVNGSGNIFAEGVLKESDQAIFNVNGSGSITADIDSMQNIRSVINGSGDIVLSGAVSNHNIKISGSGDIKSFGLKSDNTVVKISGSGNCRIHADVLLDAKILGSGDIYYKGSPELVTKIRGSGKIRKSE